MDESKKAPELKRVEVMADSEKAIPKVASHVNFSMMNNGNVLFNFVWKQDINERGILIDSVMVDYNHAKQIIEVLGGLIEKREADMKKKN